MNGRVYDPAIGRFQSADPYVPEPYNGQSFNRYSYVLNSPLSYTDPSGFDWESWDYRLCDGDCYFPATFVDPHDHLQNRDYTVVPNGNVTQEDVQLRYWDDLSGAEKFVHMWMGISRQGYETLPQETLDELLDMAMFSERMSWGAGSGGGGLAGLGAIPRNLAARGAYSLVTHIPSAGRKFNQLVQRGWSRDSINQSVNNPYATRAATNRATGNPATAYVRSDGHYVVRDNVTGDLVQMSDTRLRIGTGADQWRPDSSIINPLFPGP